MRPKMSVALPVKHSLCDDFSFTNAVWLFNLNLNFNFNFNLNLNFPDYSVSVDKIDANNKSNKKTQYKS